MRHIRFGKQRADSPADSSGNSSPPRVDGDAPVDSETVWSEIEALTWRLDQDGAIALLTRALRQVEKPPLGAVQWMLRWAQFLKETGDLEHAAAALALAVDGMERMRPNQFTIEMYLRLPAYLAAVGQTDRAWAALEHRLAWVRARVAPPRRWFLESAVQEAMRRALQRQGRFEDAVVAGALSHLLRAQGLFEAGRHAELASHRSRRVIEAAVRAPLRKSADPSCLGEICDVIEQNELRMLEADADDLARRVRRIVSTGRDDRSSADGQARSGSTTA